jgi:F-type H+-transporting ATPase subunit gamma
VFGSDEALVREYLFVSLFRACTEHNIDQLLEELHKTFYRQRQTKLDEELFDVIAGVEALAAGSTGA